MKRIIYTLFMVVILGACKQSEPEQFSVNVEITQISFSELSLVVLNESSTEITLEGISFSEVTGVSLEKEAEDNKEMIGEWVVGIFGADLTKPTLIEIGDSYETLIPLGDQTEAREMVFTLTFSMGDERHHVRESFHFQ